MEITESQIIQDISEGKTKRIYEVFLKEKDYVTGFRDKGIINSFKCRFFVIKGQLYYQPLRRKRSGFSFTFGFNLLKIVELNETNKSEKQYNVLDNAKTLLKKIHPNVWQDLRKELQNAIDKNDANLLEYKYMIHGKPKYRNIAADIKKFEDKYGAQHITKRIEDSFNDTGNTTGRIYSWSHNTTRHSGRDLSLSIERSEKDGLLRAWFSSEFKGYGNGDYYLLINPTTAIFCERD